VSSPLFATAVGLLMNALEHNTYEAEEVVLESDQNEAQAEEAPDPKDVAMKRKSILDRFGEKLKEFLDNA
jgi:cell division protein FtsA